jgi:sec-independent protein translocase protein TatA
MGSLGSTELIIIVVIVLLVFGGSQLPKLAKNLGKAQKEFKQGLSDGMKDDAKSDAPKSEAPKSDVPSDAPTQQ